MCVGWGDEGVVRVGKACFSGLISSGGILGCGWLRLMPSSKACTG
jgi:hypothetical protein